MLMRLRGGFDEDYDHTRVFADALSPEELREKLSMQSNANQAVRNAAAIHR